MKLTHYPSTTLTPNLADEIRKMSAMARFSTPNSIARGFALLSEWTGLDIVAIWEFRDQDGLGGGYCYGVSVPDKCGLFLAPSEIARYLNEGDVPLIFIAWARLWRPHRWIREIFHAYPV